MSLWLWRLLDACGLMLTCHCHTLSVKLMGTRCGKSVLQSLSFSPDNWQCVTAIVCFLYDSVMASILAACFKNVVTFICARLPILVIGRWLCFIAHEPVMNPWGCFDFVKCASTCTCTMCAVLFVSLYITVYVCLSCCVYKYIFCTECTKGLGLSKSTIRPALYFTMSHTHILLLAPDKSWQNVRTTCLLEKQISGMGNNASR